MKNIEKRKKKLNKARSRSRSDSEAKRTTRDTTNQGEKHESNMDIELQNVLNWIIFNGSWQKPSDEERKVADQFLERTPRKSKEPGFTKKKRKPKSQYSKTTLNMINLREMMEASNFIAKEFQVEQMSHIVMVLQSLIFRDKMFEKGELDAKSKAYRELAPTDRVSILKFIQSQFPFIEHWSFHGVEEDVLELFYRYTKKELVIQLREKPSPSGFLFKFFNTLENKFNAELKINLQGLCQKFHASMKSQNQDEAILNLIPDVADFINSTRNLGTLYWMDFLYQRATTSKLDGLEEFIQLSEKKITKDLESSISKVKEALKTSEKGSIKSTVGGAIRQIKVSLSNNIGELYFDEDINTFLESLQLEAFDIWKKINWETLNWLVTIFDSIPSTDKLSEKSTYGEKNLVLANWVVYAENDQRIVIPLMHENVGNFFATSNLTVNTQEKLQNYMESGLFEDFKIEDDAPSYCCSNHGEKAIGCCIYECQGYLKTQLKKVMEKHGRITRMEFEMVSTRITCASCEYFLLAVFPHWLQKLLEEFQISNDNFRINLVYSKVDQLESCKPAEGDKKVNGNLYLDKENKDFLTASFVKSLLYEEIENIKPFFYERTYFCSENDHGVVDQAHLEAQKIARNLNNYAKQFNLEELIRQVLSQEIE